MPSYFTRIVSTANVKITASIEADKSAKADLLIPDPPAASGLDIINNATKTQTTGNNTKSN
jgi:hypothetical protein